MPSKLDHYTLTRTLGQGVSAVVKLGQSSDGSKVALKIFDKQNPNNTKKALDALKTEVEIFKKLNHPYMVKLIEFKEHAVWVRSEGNIAVAYIALELIEGGELFAFSGGSKTIERDKPIIFTEILRKYCLKYNYNHNEIFEWFYSRGYRAFTVHGKTLKSFKFMDENTLQTNFFFLHAKKHSSAISELEV